MTAERYRLMRELGSRAVATYAAAAPRANGEQELFVVERIVRGGAATDEEVGDYVRDAKRVAELDHPNIGRVREVAIRADGVLVASDFVDGENLAALWRLAERRKTTLTIDVVLRIAVDVLTGLGALHNLRDAHKEPLKLVHGEVTPTNMIVGTDGATRVVHVCRVKSAATRPARGDAGYLAPEILLADGSADARADVYSVGAILWQALSGRPLFPDGNPTSIVGQLLSGKLPRPDVPADLPWGNDLVTIVLRALAADPGARYPNAAAMAAEIRRIAATAIATPRRVSAVVNTFSGERIAARRAHFLGNLPPATMTGSHERPTFRPPQPMPDEPTTSPHGRPTIPDEGEISIDVEISPSAPAIPIAAVAIPPPPRPAAIQAPVATRTEPPAFRAKPGRSSPTPASSAPPPAPPMSPTAPAVSRPPPVPSKPPKPSAPPFQAERRVTPAPSAPKVSVAPSPLAGASHSFPPTGPITAPRVSTAPLAVANVVSPLPPEVSSSFAPPPPMPPPSTAPTIGTPAPSYALSMGAGAMQPPVFTPMPLDLEPVPEPPRDRKLLLWFAAGASLMVVLLLVWGLIGALRKDKDVASVPVPSGRPEPTAPPTATAAASTQVAEPTTTSPIESAAPSASAAPTPSPTLLPLPPKLPVRPKPTYDPMGI